MQYPEAIAKLIESYSKLPGIGRKSATRLAFYTLGMSDDDVKNFARSLSASKSDLTFCRICGFITSKDDDPCVICSDESRDQSKIFVVENSQDEMAIENTHDYHGLYHVLNGVLSPMDGRGPEDINITSLITRLSDHSEVKEVIIGLDASTEGEATTLYLARLIRPSGIKVTRLARGLSVGTNVDYADQLTLTQAVNGRTEI
ncbi:recombination mediator RecR [Oenococcus oeni]|uniref:recombination mediator RecR n=1 Tax=Oenococcus oeni TaxID=1247 RepID=UPI0010B8DEAC|nr:recombination mediator RecR [Oenococcus oeni]SYW08817.1 recA filament-DNA complex stabilisation factor [Oenococcus oeni]